MYFHRHIMSIPRQQTTLVYASDFSVNQDGWTSFNAEFFSGNIDDVFESDFITFEDDCLQYNPDANNSNHYIEKSGILTVGQTYRISTKLLVEFFNINTKGAKIYNGVNEIYYQNIIDSWNSFSTNEFVASSQDIRVYGTDSLGNLVYSGSGDSFFIKDFIVETVS